MKRHTSMLDEKEYESGTSKNHKRKKLLSSELQDMEEDLSLDEHFPWHRLRRLHRK